MHDKNSLLTFRIKGRYLLNVKYQNSPERGVFISQDKPYLVASFFTRALRRDFLRAAVFFLMTIFSAALSRAF